MCTFTITLQEDVGLLSPINTESCKKSPKYYTCITALIMVIIVGHTIDDIFHNISGKKKKPKLWPQAILKTFNMSLGHQT